MPGHVPGIHVLEHKTNAKDVDGRDKPGHDDAGKHRSNHAAVRSNTKRRLIMYRKIATAVVMALVLGFTAPATFAASDRDDGIVRVKSAYPFDDTIARLKSD